MRQLLDKAEMIDWSADGLTGLPIEIWNFADVQSEFRPYRLYLMAAVLVAVVLVAAVLVAALKMAAVMVNVLQMNVLQVNVLECIWILL